MNWRRLVGIGAVGATAAVAGITAINLAGRRVRARAEHELDDPLTPPTDVEHLQLDTPDGGTLHAVLTGRGRPVVLLHGVTLQWWVWSAVIRLLRDRYQVVTWDMRGHGESIAGDRGVTLEACADDLHLLVEHLDLHDAVVVGHSMGGMVLGRFAVQHHAELHERMSGLVFLSTSAAPASFAGLQGGLASAAKLISRSAERADRTGRSPYNWREGNVSALMARPVFGRRVTNRMVDDVRQMLAAVSQRTVAESCSSIATHDVRAELAAVDLPAWVVVGDRDVLTPVAHARGIAESIPGSKLEVLHDVGHQVMQEDPAAVALAVDRLAS